MRHLLALFPIDRADLDRHAETAASLAADAATMRAATVFAATIVGGIYAIALGVEIVAGAAI